DRHVVRRADARAHRGRAGDRAAAAAGRPDRRLRRARREPRVLRVHGLWRRRVRAAAVRDRQLRARRSAAALAPGIDHADRVRFARVPAPAGRVARGGGTASGALFLLGVLFVCLAAGVPVAIALGLASIGTLLLFADQSLVTLAQRFFSATQVYPLLAIPFF